MTAFTGVLWFCLATVVLFLAGLFCVACVFAADWYARRIERKDVERLHRDLAAGCSPEEARRRIEYARKTREELMRPRGERH
jgi:hypothetical protein